MKRVNENNLNTREYWDDVYLKERFSGKRRIDDERLQYVIGQAKDYWQTKPLEEERTFLDVGCGDGEFLRFFHAHLPSWKLTGIDITPKILDIARTETPGIDFKLGDVNDLPFADHFDIVFMGETLEHLEDPNNAIKQLFKAVKPAGYVIVSTPNEHNNYSPEHINEFTIGELIQMIEPHGKVKYQDIRAVCNGISIIVTAIK